MKAAGVLLRVILAVPLFGANANAQSVQRFDVAEYSVEGVQVNCEDTPTEVRRTADDLIAAPDNRRIVIHGPAFDPLPPGVRLFLYYETCAAIFYRGDRAQADLSAVRVGVGQRWLAAADVEAICETDLLAVAGWSAAPDDARCQGLYAAMREALQ